MEAAQSEIHKKLRCDACAHVNLVWRLCNTTTSMSKNKKKNPVGQKNVIWLACQLQYKAKKATKLNQHVSATHPPFLRHESTRHTIWKLCLGPIEQWHQHSRAAGQPHIKHKK